MQFLFHRKIEFIGLLSIMNNRFINLFSLCYGYSVTKSNDFIKNRCEKLNQYKFKLLSHFFLFYRSTPV